MSRCCLLIGSSLILLAVCAAQAQTNCYDTRTGTWVPDTPGACGGSSQTQRAAPAPAAAAPALSPMQSAVVNAAGNISYQLGAAFGNWLAHAMSGPDPAVQQQQQQMMAELQRRQQEAIRLHKEQEAQQLAATYNRLIGTLKLTGLPQLEMKDTGMQLPELHMKLTSNGDEGIGQNGIKGLPGINLNGDNSPAYGIPGLPGIYTGGAGPEVQLTNTLLPMKTGDQTAANAAPAQLDPSNMTPQQLADAAEAYNKLTPEQQQRILQQAQQQTDAGQTAPGPATTASAPATVPAEGSGQIPGQGIADSSRAAAAASDETASGIARTGFDTAGAPEQPLTVKLSGMDTTAPAEPAVVPSQSTSSIGVPANPGGNLTAGSSVVNLGRLNPDKPATVDANALQENKPAPNGSRYVNCEWTRTTRDQLAGGLPVQEDAIRRTEAQLEAARKGVEEANAERKKVLREGAADEVEEYAKEILTSADKLRIEIEALQGLDKAKRDLIIRTVNTLVFEGKSLYKAGNAGVQAASMQEQVNSANRQVEVLYKIMMEGGIAEKVGEKGAEELGGPLGALAFRGAKVSIDLSVAVGNGTISQDEELTAQENLETMKSQYQHIEDRIAELNTDLNELCEK